MRSGRGGGHRSNTKVACVAGCVRCSEQKGTSPFAPPTGEAPDAVPLITTDRGSCPLGQRRGSVLLLLRRRLLRRSLLGRSGLLGRSSLLRRRLLGRRGLLS